jgi:hypothetical protein
VLAVDLDRNLSNEHLKYYGVRFSIDDSQQMYRASISVADGRVKKMEVGQIFR